MSYIALFRVHKDTLQVKKDWTTQKVPTYKRKHTKTHTRGVDAKLRSSNIEVICQYSCRDTKAVKEVKVKCYLQKSV